MIVYGIELSGQQGSGKTTTLNGLKAYAEKNGIKFVGVKFAETLYAMHDAVRKVALERGIDMPVKDGKLLQLLGTEWGRNNYGENIWVDSVKKTINTVIESEKYGDTTDVKVMIVIDDCRFPNELEAFKNNFLTVRLTADRDARKGRADSWRDTENHASETALDGMEDQFDLVLDTVALDKEKVVSTIVDMMVLRGKKV